MKRLLIITVLLGTRLLGANADVDPNFYIYICFGQSNMEGNAKAESVDKSNVDKRFRLLATCNYDSPKRTMGQWYDAIPPLVNPVGGLGPTDYFGRTMVAALPSNVRIGVIPVAMGGSPIEMFDKDKYQKLMKEKSGEWWAQIARNNYNSNPYGRIIEMAKKAQEVGVIKGILLHQGCSNNGDPNWPNMVKKIYNDMLTDLGLAADTVPLFVGETLRQENGGACYGHNTQVNRMPSVVPTSHVVSSFGLPGNGQDPWHFNAVGYRIFGKRYAFEALKLMGREQFVDPDYKMAASLEKFYAVKSLTSDDEILVLPGQTIPVKATFKDNHEEEVSDYVTFRSDEIQITDGRISGVGNGKVDIVYTDFTRKETSATVNMNVTFFPFTAEYLQKRSGTATFDYTNRAITFSGGAQAGWVYDKAVDMSAYKYLVVKLKEPQDIGAEVRLSASKNTGSVGFRDTINDRTVVSIDLHNMIYSKTKVLDPAKIFMVTFRCAKKGTLHIDDMFLTNDDQYAPDATAISSITRTATAASPVYTLDGRRAPAAGLKPGVYVSEGKKIIVK